MNFTYINQDYIALRDHAVADARRCCRAKVLAAVARLLLQGRVLGRLWTPEPLYR